MGMTAVRWGDEIPVDGARPSWLGRDATFRVRGFSGNFYGPYLGDPTPGDITWPQVKTVRLSADHFVYLAIAKGYEPWGGGPTAPDDWDGQHVLFRNGNEYSVAAKYSWTHPHERDWGTTAGGDIIGYRKRTWTKGAPFDQEVAPPTLTQMTAGEARMLWLRCSTGDLSVKAPHGFYAPDVAVRMLDHLGFIRPNRNPLEQFLAEHPEADPATADMALTWAERRKSG